MMEKSLKYRWPAYGLLMAATIFAIAMGCDIVDPERQVHNTNYSAVETFSFESDAEGKSAFEISSINGPIEIEGVPGAKVVTISGEKRVESESEYDASAHLKDLEIQIYENSELVRVETDQPKQSNGRNYSVSYNIYVPDTWTVSVELVNGQVSVDSLDSDVAVSLVNGNINLGEVFGSVHAHTTNGQIDGRLKLPKRGTCDLKTTNGIILLSIPKSTSADLSAGVTNGIVSVTDLSLKNMSGSNRYIQGRLGDGEGRISLQTTNGNISVRGY